MIIEIGQLYYSPARHKQEITIQHFIIKTLSNFYESNLMTDEYAIKTGMRVNSSLASYSLLTDIFRVLV